MEPDPTTGAILTPIYQTTTYRQNAVGSDKGYTYSRAGNPTVKALEDRIATLEKAEYATCFSSGLAATNALFLTLLKAGDRVVVSDVCYGGTVRLLEQILTKFGVEADFVDTSDEAKLTESLQKPAALVFIETPANPTLKLTDIALAARLAHDAGALLATSFLNRQQNSLTAIMQRSAVLLRPRTQSSTKRSSSRERRSVRYRPRSTRG